MEYPDYTELMRQWRDGLLSNAEILAWTLNAVAEVQQAMLAEETAKADARLLRIGVVPFSSTPSP